MPTLGHALHIEKQSTKLIVTSFLINIRLGVSCKSIKPQNDPTPYEHVIKVSCYYRWNVTHTCKKELPSHLNCLAL